jgi:SAM-dependent methyltransferase
MNTHERPIPTSILERLSAFGLGDEDAAAWAAAGLPDDEFDGWLMDRVARRPSGSRAREVYGADDVHDFAVRALMQDLELGPDDCLLDIGCGGGILLAQAAATGCLTSGLDHSAEMVALARERAPAADVIEGDAGYLPFPDGSFTAVSMSVVFFFLDDPVAVLRECRRVLRPGGRLAVYTTAPEMRGTPAAPEPFASRSHFYTDRELSDLASEAGFTAVRVRNEDGGQLLSATAPSR